MTTNAANILIEEGRQAIRSHNRQSMGHLINLCTGSTRGRLLGMLALEVAIHSQSMTWSMRLLQMAYHCVMDDYKVFYYLRLVHRAIVLCCHNDECARRARERWP